MHAMLTSWKIIKFIFFWLLTVLYTKRNVFLLRFVVQSRREKTRKLTTVSEPNKTGCYKNREQSWIPNTEELTVLDREIRFRNNWFSITVNWGTHGSKICMSLCRENL